MTVDQWRQLESLYHAALELEPEVRAAFIAKVCGDDFAMRQELESLLIYENEASEFLETPGLSRPFERPASPRARLFKSFVAVLRLGVEYLLARRVLQAAMVVPVVVVAINIVRNRNRTIAELVRGDSGYFYWIAASALALRYRGKIRSWLDGKIPS